MPEMSRHKSRPGFSLIEILIVVVIVGVLTMIAAPRVRATSDQYNVKAARERIASSVATARATAIHSGRESVFWTSGNWFAVWTQNPTTGAWQQAVPWQNMISTHSGVNLQIGGAGWSYVWFEPRGLTKYRPSSTVVFRLVGKATTDSVCVSRLGQILPNNCAL